MSGSYISFDFEIHKLKKYYSQTSYSKAYEDVRKFFVDKGYQHLKDTNYVSESILETQSVDYVFELVDKYKWVAVCVKKINVMPLMEQWDLKEAVELAYMDEGKRNRRGTYK